MKKDIEKAIKEEKIVNGNFKIIIQKDNKEVCVLVKGKDKDNLRYLGLLMRKCFNTFGREKRKEIIKMIEQEYK